MRILLLVDCYLPSTKSSAKLVHDLALEFIRQGHTVTIGCPDDSLTIPCMVETVDSLTVLRVRTGQIKGAARWLRGINEARLSHTFWKRGGQYFRTHPHDLVVFYSPTIFFGGLVARLKRLWNCSSYLILRDIFPQWAVDAGVLRKGLAWWFFRQTEFAQYRAADVIGVQSPANLDYFRDLPQTRGMVLDVLYNWTTLDEGAVPQTSYRTQWGLQDKIVFFYGGNIGVAQDLGNILRLAGSLKSEPRIRFLLVGEGSEFAKLQSQVDREGLTNVQLKPAVEQREYLGMLAEFDVGLISLDRNLRTQNLPGKMLGYMYHSLPMLASVNPGNDLQSLLETQEAGLASQNGDNAQLRAHTLQLANDPELRRRLGQNGRKLLESTFSVEQAARQIVRCFPQHAAN